MQVLEKYLADFKADGVTTWIIAFHGHQEPLIIRNVGKMARLAKFHFSDANIPMCTSTQGKNDPTQIHSGMDEIGA
ncbi:MAG: hypothetical protein AAGG57_05800 [Pseudomonadota bacterium]